MAVCKLSASKSTLFEFFLCSCGVIGCHIKIDQLHSSRKHEASQLVLLQSFISPTMCATWYHEGVCNKKNLHRAATDTLALPLCHIVHVCMDKLSSFGADAIATLFPNVYSTPFVACIEVVGTHTYHWIGHSLGWFYGLSWWRSWAAASTGTNTTSTSTTTRT